MKHFAYVLFFLLFANVCRGQLSQAYTQPNAELSKALQLFNHKQYKAAQHFFLRQKNNTTDAQTLMLCDFYIASTAVRLQQAGAEMLMQNFLKEYPASGYATSAVVDVADFYFSQNNFKKALSWYQNLSPEQIPENERDKHLFQQGYAYFSQGDENQAQKLFSSVKKNSPYASKASYYLGYMAYGADDYDQAQQYFEELQGDEQLSKNLSYYQADMNFKQGNFDKSLQQGLEQLRKTKNAKEISEINKIIGESYFNLKHYDKAIPYLKAYKGKNGKYSNTDFYYLGYAYYKQNDYPNAIAQFSKIINGSNAVAQNAYYHLAECYLKTDKKQQALNAFRNASEMEFDPQIKKDAMLNYVRLSYDIGNPYQSVPSVIQNYIDTYPTLHTTEMQELLVNSYITSGEYKTALQLIEKQGIKDKKLYAQVAFNQAMQLYGDGQYTQALELLKKAQQPQNPSINARAKYWEGEVNYLLGNFSEAEKNYLAFNQLKNNNLPESKKVFYGLGYAYFNQKKYEQAAEAFTQFLSTKPQHTLSSDATIRLADSYFALGKYWPAMEAYNKIIATNDTDADYSTFQKAISYGLVERPKRKIEELNAFTEKYPKSNLRQDALYELANSYLAQGNTQEALQKYQQIEQEYNTGNFVAKAMLQQALIHYNQGQNPKAVSILKKITEKFPNTSEAAQAVATAKAVYVDMGQVNQYAQWVKNLGYNISDNELDNASFEAAEKQYLQQNTAQAITELEKYLRDFPQGINALTARYYLAELYYNSGKKSLALPLYEKIISTGKNPYTEPSLVHVAQTYLSENQPIKAIPVLTELENSATIVQNLTYARSNLMKIYYNNEDYTQTISYANKVLEISNLDSRIKNDAHIMLARCYFKTGNLAQAEKFYAEVRKNASGELMAEALYYQAYFENQAKQYQKSNETIQKLAKDFGGYKEFSAKGLVLMAKNFNALNDGYQANYILKSVIKNFTDYPEVVQEAQKTLSEIKTENQPENTEL